MRPSLSAATSPARGRRIPARPDPVGRAPLAQAATRPRAHASTHGTGAAAPPARRGWPGAGRYCGRTALQRARGHAGAAGQRTTAARRHPRASGPTARARALDPAASFPRAHGQTHPGSLRVASNTEPRFVDEHPVTALPRPRATNCTRPRQASLLGTGTARPGLPKKGPRTRY